MSNLSPSFAAACRAADEKQRHKPVDENIKRARRLLADDVTLERAWRETNHKASAEGRAAASTVEALMFALREGVVALGRPETIQRLSQIDDQQLRAVMVRLQKFESEVAKAWTPEDIAVLVTVRGKIHE